MLYISKEIKVVVNCKLPKYEHFTAACVNQILLFDVIHYISYDARL